MAELDVACQGYGFCLDADVFILEAGQVVGQQFGGHQIERVQLCRVHTSWCVPW